MGKTKEKKAEKEHKKNTSLRLDAKTLKELKLIALQEDTSVQMIVEKLIDDYLGARKES